MTLTLEEASRIISAAIAKAHELNVRVSVAVCDSAGRLICFSRMDGAILGGVYGAQGKAIASAVFGRASGELQERATTPIVRGIIAAEGSGMIVSQGAVPIFRAGHLIGACGVGGATSQQDEDIARAAITQTVEAAHS